MKKFHNINGPYVRSSNSTDKIMIHLFISLLPIIIFSFYKNGIYLYINGYANVYEMFKPLLFIVIGGLSSFLFETLYYKFIKHNSWLDSIKNKYAIFPGLFLSLVVPLNTPILILIIGSFIATVVGKLMYGGFGNNIFNPALIGCLFIMAIYSSNIGTYLNNYEIDTVSSATPLTNQVLVDKVSYENLIGPYGSLYNFFTGMIPGSVGETCSLLIIISFFYLAFAKVIKVRIPIIYVGTVFILTYFIGTMNGLGIWYPLFQILSGGLLFGAVFMATDPVTSPVTKIGQVLYGVTLGILTVLFRYLTSAPEGVMTSILTVNMLVFIFDKIGIKAKGKDIKWIIYLLIIGIIFIISLSLKNVINTKNVDNNFELISVNEENGNKVYLVNEVGNGGKINIEIVLNDNKVISYKVLSHNETKAYYSKIEESNYIQKLVKNSNKLNSVDTVSGATISSSALKKALQNVLELEGIYEK